MPSCMLRSVDHLDLRMPTRTKKGLSQRETAQVIAVYLQYSVAAVPSLSAVRLASTTIFEILQVYHNQQVDPDAAVSQLSHTLSFELILHARSCASRTLAKSIPLIDFSSDSSHCQCCRRLPGHNPQQGIPMRNAFPSHRPTVSRASLLQS